MWWLAIWWVSGAWGAEVMSAGEPYGNDCYKACQQHPLCLAYYEPHLGVVPLPRCLLAVHDGKSSVYPEVASGVHGNASVLDCVARNNQTCFQYNKMCVACPAQPTDWLENVGPDYVVVFASTCCPAAHTDVNVVWNNTSPMILPYDNITIRGFVGEFMRPYFVLETQHCPLLEIQAAYTVTSAVVLNLNLVCPKNSVAGVLVSGPAEINLTAVNITVDGARSAIMVVGGNHNTTPPFSGTVTTGTRFSGIIAKSSGYPNPAAVALANTEGSGVQLSDFDETQLIVVQPYLGDSASANGFDILDDSMPRVFNITEFTLVFGQMYEIAYYNRNAYEENELTVALKSVLFYQVWAFLGLLTMIMVVHQDIVYYLGVGARRSQTKTPSPPQKTT